MAELTIEQKAERYDVAIRRAKSKIKNDKDHVLYEDDVLEIFPELAEEYDEKIRKALIDGFTVMKESKNCGKTFSNHNIPVADIIVWLEKQGEKEKFIKKELDNIRGYREEALRRLQELEKQGEQNLVWSEGDERCIRELESLVKQAWASAERGNDEETIRRMSDLAFFLKTLKPQLKQECCEDVERNVKELEYLVAANYLVSEEPHDRLINFLEAIVHKSQWKPSTAQMNALDSTLQYSKVSRDSFEHLNSLFNDLKKLK